MPGTRGTLPAAKSATNLSGASDACARLSRTASIPDRQVSIRKKTSAPKVRGSQPPSAIFSRLAPKNPTSTIRKSPAIRIETASGQRHVFRIAVKSRQVVSSIVVDTAVP
ncbi:hypothetical protein D9M73_242450 [compost metagenome]